MALIDWLIIILFLAILMTIGFLFSRKNRNIEDYFVAGRSMPGWIVAIAATGTAISAGTFVGSPELGFNTNLTYVMNLIGAIIGGSLVAVMILPKLYNERTITIYGYIGNRFGEKSRRANSLMFLVGQLFNSGSRLFITAIFTKRGNYRSVAAALVAGAVITLPLMFQQQLFGHNYIAWTWWCPIGGIMTTAICMLGKTKEQ